MNNTLHCNGTNYLSTIANLNNVPCAGLGLSCSRLYTVKHIVSYIATAGNFFIIPFILYLTFAKVMDGFFKYFTLNLMINCTTSVIVAFIVDIINIAKLYVPINESNFSLIGIKSWIRFYMRLESIWFHGLTLYAGVVCYLPYVRPLFYSRNFVNKSQKLYYIVLHISTILWGVFVSLLYKESINRILYFLTQVTLFIASFITAMRGSIIIGKYKSLGANANQVAKLQQKRLYSFILYCYSIEIIILPVFVLSSAHAICIFAGCEQNFVASRFVRILNLLIYYIYEMRTIIIVSILILALEPYRRAISSLCYRKNWTTNVHQLQLRKAHF